MALAPRATGGRVTSAAGTEAITPLAMTSLLALALALQASPARAGDLLLKTTEPVRVELNGVPVARALAAGEITLTDVEPGTLRFEVVRGDGRRQPVDVEMPVAGTVTLSVDAVSASTDSPAPADEAAGPPQVTIRAAAGQRFLVMLDGEPAGTATDEAPLVLAAPSVGAHALQIRSVDRLTIWARGELELVEGDVIELLVEEGRLVRPSGREGAWNAR
jgi:hypothetical protein